MSTASAYDYAYSNSPQLAQLMSQGSFIGGLGSSAGTAIGNWANQTETVSYPPEYRNFIEQIQRQQVYQPFQNGLPGRHNGDVRHFRKAFKEYSKEDFKQLSKRPLVKEILGGLTKLNREEISNRIKEHLDEITNQ